MASTGKGRALLAAAVESVLRGIVRPSRLARRRVTRDARPEMLEQRMFLSSSPPAWLDPNSAATWDPNAHALTVTGPATIVADPGADEPLVSVSGTTAALTIEPTTDTWVHLGGLTLTGGGSAEVTRPGATSFDENASLVLDLGAPGGTSTSVLSIDAGTGSTLGIEDNDLIVRGGLATEPDYVSSIALGGTLDPAAFRQDGLAMPSDPAIAATEPSQWDAAGRTVTLGPGDVLVKHIPNSDPVGGWATPVGGDSSSTSGSNTGPVPVREQIGPRYVAMASFDSPALASGPVPASVSSVVINGNTGSLLGPQRSMVDNVLYTFSEKVTLDPSAAFTIKVAAGQTGTIPTLNWAPINPDANGAV